MFDPRRSLFGVPASVIVLTMAVLGAVVGLLWMRRLLTIEPDTHTFRATARPARWGRLLVAAGLLVTGVLLAMLVLGVRLVE